MNTNRRMVHLMEKKKKVVQREAQEGFRSRSLGRVQGRLRCLGPDQPRAGAIIL